MKHNWQRTSQVVRGGKRRHLWEILTEISLTVTDSINLSKSREIHAEFCFALHLQFEQQKVEGKLGCKNVISSSALNTQMLLAS